MTQRDPDSQILLELLRQRLRSTRRSQRDLERELNLGHGTLGNLLRGRTELRMRHLKMLGKALGFDPIELLAEAYGSSRVLPEPAAGFTWEELRELIADALREELDRRGVGTAESGRSRQDR